MAQQTDCHISLAPGVRVRGGAISHHAMLLSALGAAHLNQHAAAILGLCDGTRCRSDLIVDAVLHSSGMLRAADVVEFLDAAQARGWIVENALAPPF